MATQTSPPINNRRFVDEAGNPIVPGQMLGEGGEGWVYRVDGLPNSVMKVWRPGKTPPDAETKIGYLTRNPVRPDPRETWRITWPQHLVKENGGVVGYTMPLLDSSWEPIVKYYNLKAAEATEAEQGRELRIDDRVRMARNVALGFRAVHEVGYVIGDVNEKNVEVNRQNDIALVDCDSYGFTDRATGQAFSNNMGRPEFQAPEAQGNFENRTQDHDLFGLSIIIFLLLTGYHPHTITGQHAQDYNTHGARISAWLFPPANLNVSTTQDYSAAWDRLTIGQKELFRRCFDRVYAGQPRPTPLEWLEALQELPEERPSPQPQSQPQPQPVPQPQSRSQPRPSTARPARPSVFRRFSDRLSIRHILLTGMANPVVALMVLLLYWRGGRTSLTRASGTALLLLLSLSLNVISCIWGNTHLWWWILSPVVALLLLAVTARWRRLPHKAIASVASLWVLWLLILNPGIGWIQDPNDGEAATAASTAIAPAVAVPAPSLAEGACSAPINLRHGDFNADEQSLQFSWDAPTDGDATVTSYSLRVRKAYATGTYSNWSRTTLFEGQHGTETNREVPFVSNDEGEEHALQFAVIAFCDPQSGSGGFPEQSELSNIVEYTVPGELAPTALRNPNCDGPTNLRLGEFDSDNRSLTLIWDPPTDGEVDATGYVRNGRWLRPDGTYSDWVDMPGSYKENEPGYFRIRFSDSAEERTYQFHIIAQCGELRGSRSEPSNIVEFTVPSR